MKKNEIPAIPTPPSNGEMTKAGTFDGDLRNLPAERPIRRELPRRPDPAVVPRPAPTPKSPKKPE